MPPETRRGPWWSRPGAVLHAAVSFWAGGRPWAGAYLPLVRGPVETCRRPERRPAPLAVADCRRSRAVTGGVIAGRSRVPLRAFGARAPWRHDAQSASCWCQRTGVGARRESRARSRCRAGNSSGARARAGSGSAVSTCSLAHRTSADSPVRRLAAGGSRRATRQQDSPHLDIATHRRRGTHAVRRCLGS